MSASRSQRSVPWLLVGLAGLVAVAVGAFLLGRGVSSPEQAIADAAAPPPSLIVASVLREELVAEVRLRGDVTLQDTSQVPVTADPDTSTSVVTGLHVTAGDPVVAGTPLVSVNGVPRLACPAAFAFFRTITPGATGPDVAELQRCLIASGHLPDGADDGRFGPATQAAAAAMFAVDGFDLSSTIDPAALAARDAARAQVSSAREALADAEVALAAARAAHAAELATHAATEADGSPVGGPPIAPSGTLVERARTTLRQAETTLVAAEAAVGARIAPHLLMVVPGLPRTVATLGVSVGDVITGDGVSVTLAGDTPLLDVRIPSDRPDIAALQPGQVLDVLTDRSEALAATVAHVTRPAAGEDGRLVAHFDDEVPGDAIGSSLLVVATLDSTGGEVLTVPITAIQTDTAGRHYVRAVEGSPVPSTEAQVAVIPASVGTRRVEVAVGLRGADRVQVTVDDGQLAAGDQVVLGVHG